MRHLPRPILAAVTALALGAGAVASISARCDRGATVRSGAARHVHQPAPARSRWRQDRRAVRRSGRHPLAESLGRGLVPLLHARRHRLVPAQSRRVAGLLEHPDLPLDRPGALVVRRRRLPDPAGVDRQRRHVGAGRRVRRRPLPALLHGDRTPSLPGGGSAIGVATSDSPAGPWIDSRRSGRRADAGRPGSADPNDRRWVYDPEVLTVGGENYLYFGSYYGGLSVRRRERGRPRTPTRRARRRSRSRTATRARTSSSTTAGTTCSARRRTAATGR